LNRDKLIAFSHSLFLPVIYSRQPNRKQLRIFLVLPRAKNRKVLLDTAIHEKEGDGAYKRGCEADNVPFVVSLLLSVLSWIFSFSFSFSG